MNEVNNNMGNNEQVPNVQPEINQNMGNPIPNSQPVQPEPELEPIETVNLDSQPEVQPVPTQQPSVQPVEPVPTQQPSIQPVEPVPTQQPSIQPVEPVPTQQPNVQPVEPQPVINPIPQEPQNKEQKPPKKNKTLIICIVMIIIGIIAGVAVYFLTRPSNDSKPNNDKTKQTEKDNNKKETTIPDNNTSNDNTKEVEVSLSDYSKLLKKFINDNLFYKNGYLEGKLVSSSINYNTLSKHYFIETALEDLYENNKFEKGEYDNYINDFSDSRIKSSDVDNKIKELFGNIEYKHQTTQFYIYKDNYYYAKSGRGGMISFKEEAISIPLKAAMDDKNIYIYASVGVVDFTNVENPKLYDSLDKKNEINVKIDDGEFGLSVAGDRKYDGLSIGDYMKKYQDKFSQYKYTFTKSGDNYQFTNLEKVK